MSRNLIFHAFTGCDIVSIFYSKGKCKAWYIWMNSSEKESYTDIFTKLGNKPLSLTEDDLDYLKKFVLELYQLSVHHKPVFYLQCD